MEHHGLDAWLARIERAHPSEIDLGLDRIGQVLKRLALSHTPKVITVAGTNGKGSCVTATSAILKAMGHSVGSYTSPHLHHYCERVAIDGTPVSEAAMCEAFDSIERARGSISLTYFEYGTLAALWLFDRSRVDICVLEVGLGGRLDAVNVIDADVAVIASIDIDHQDWLGNDREVIGREKAGIMRAAKPVVCADVAPPQSVVDWAQEIGAQPLYINRDFSIEPHGAGALYQYGDFSVSLAEVYLPLPSVAAAITAVQILVGRVEPDLLSRALAEVSLAGRNQRLWVGKRQILLDVAHNPAATRLLAQQITQCAPARVHFVFAAMADKDIDGIVDNLPGAAGAWYLAYLPDVPRAAEPQALATRIATRGWSVVCTAAMADCLERAINNATEDDLVVVFGSFFTVSAALSALPNIKAAD
ncbi:bifunctional tetrahydrofolate synthase/dihydrofolate synthase [Gilvimarinus sp. 1_MG-2023]|uniref:bifunctional tetrahydrofolate synthase/dihydrofolate synthase n=1 Tax=Gilvimarinus sp. 1_MG-2023 TaxID=3062638 RepID=UPI0026E287B7|nr:bifunctional tetrahydrofolate synthase/dihydrofolate synthase [Gilvimarinus sp. 1_MG-2023]MDO6747251.1 bifunctional tetrahydrofolate synthase/dihydrofolate synthase [Gilvimarinus sp. 1_MG-2023]